MYRKRGHIDLEALASKVRRKNQAKAYAMSYKPATAPATPPTTTYKRVTYATSDINAAKSVLQRLLDCAGDEITSIEEAPVELDEI